jgi:hypothetical protein
MVRECATRLLLLPAVAAVAAVGTTGCSLLLDFSDGAVLGDAGGDAPYSQAECAYKEPNDSLATAALITPADTGPAAICAGTVEDHDFYRFTVPAGATKVAVKLSYTYRSGGDLDLRLFDSSRAQLALSVGFGDQELITCPGQAPTCPMLGAGDYVLEVFPVPGSVNRYTFAVTITP